MLKVNLASEVDMCEEEEGVCKECRCKKKKKRVSARAKRKIIEEIENKEWEKIQKNTDVSTITM